ncbi:MAG TPA: AraC family transcriptional regulator [Caulobacteraceae bacterium]|jgi:AraC-like DNA-binding protein|nr:AraC family transcriptional regulator [Caulobacteraceae bacterium]
MDPLSHVLTLLQPRAVSWRVVEAHNAWTLRFLPDSNVVVFGQMIEGECDVLRGDGRALHIGQGDFMLMASPPPWEMRALGGGPPVELKALLAEPGLLMTGGEAQTVTRFMAGHFKFAAVGAELVGKLMLPIIHVRADEVAAGRLGTLLALLGDEATADRPGGPQIVKRLLEVLLVEALRHPDAGWEPARSGLLAGLADPKIGQALRLMHDDVGRGWSVGELARSVGMSRSVFAERFAGVVGAPPMEYLAGWRMTLAKQALMAGEAPMADIAEFAGYRSVSAFSTAFRRLTGSPPSRYGRSGALQAAEGA